LVVVGDHNINNGDSKMNTRSWMHGCLAAIAGLCLLIGSAAAETLSDYASHTGDSRNLTVTSSTGQKLKITAYGDYMVRVHTVRNGESFFSDTRYEMVDPANHTGMGGALSVIDNGSSFTITTAANDGVRVVLQKRPLRLEFYNKSDNALFAKEDATRSLSWSGTNNSVVKQTFVPASAQEHFFKAGHGLFGRAPKLDRTGDIVSHNYGEQSALVVPLYLSTGGYAVFFNTTFASTFNFGNGGKYEFSADSKNSGGATPQLDYYFIKGTQFPVMLDRYTQLTGRPRMPQASIFGLHMSDKNFSTTSTAAWWQDKITAHKNAGFPMDHQVNDNRWRQGGGGWCGGGAQFAFDTSRWPDPAAYQAWAVKNGVTVTLDYNRCISSATVGWVGGPPPGYSFQAADVANISSKDQVPDWSYKGTREWIWTVFWSKAVNPALKFPGDGFWLDEVDQMTDIPVTANTANGWKWSELANYYLFMLQKGIVQEGWDPTTSGNHIGNAKRPWSWARGATAGGQRFGHMWTGDINSDYTEMQNQVRGVQAAGLGGFPYANVDGGGYQAQTISTAMYRNWPAAWSSLSPIWRPHGQGSTSNAGITASRWPLDHNATEQADFLKYSKLRYTMMPYIYTIGHNAYATGMPMAKAMVIDYQNNSNAYNHDLQYMWGPSMIVAPVVSDGGNIQNIWLPAGDTWYNFWTDAKHVGTDSSDLSYTTSTGEIPLFVKAGAILPKYKYAQSTFFMDKSQLEMDVYSGKDGAFSVYEDDGVTENFRVNGASRTTQLNFTNAANKVVVSHPAGTYAGAPTARRYIVRIHGLAAPVGMRVNGGGTLPAFTSEALAIANGSGEVWDASKKILSVVTSSINVVTGGGTAATVEPSGAAFPGTSGGTLYEAESAVLSGATLHSENGGFTGTGYADYTNASGDYVEWTVNVASAGSRTLNFRYANGTANNRPLSISVNGTVVNASMAFNGTGGWTTWGNASVNANLPAGSSVKIRATATGFSGPNLDSLTLN
jgi:alpha-D-xyloside xylohydrolase